MNSQENQSAENKSKAVAHQLSEKREGGQAAPFADNRPEAVAQRKLQSLIHQRSAAGKPVVQRVVFDVENANQQLNTNQLIRQIMGSFTASGWTFPNQDDGDGCVGRLCVSQFRQAAVAGADQDLAIHISFNIDQVFIPSTNAMQAGTDVRIEVHDLHLTARPLADQQAIGALAGAITVAQRQRSVHAGPGNDWNYKGNAALTNRLGDWLNMPALGRQAALDAALDPFYAEIATYRTDLEERLRRKVKDNVNHAFDTATVVVQGGANWN